MTILQEMIELLVGGLTQMASGIGTGLNQLVTNIFISGTGEAAKLSVFGQTILGFAGIGLAVGLSKFVVNWLTSFGN